MKKSILVKSLCLGSLLLFTSKVFAQGPTLAGSGSFSVCKNSGATSINSQIAANDPDVGEILTWTVISGPSNGTLNPSGNVAVSNGGTVAPSGFTYTPNSGYSGADAFVLNVSDGSNSYSFPVSVTVNNLPTVGAGVDHGICAGASTILFGSGADTYAWDNGVTNATVFTPASTTTYTVTGTVTATGCQNTDQVVVTVNPLPTVNAPGDYAICTGQSTTLTGTGTANTYSWDNSVTNGVSFTPAGTATYTVTGTITVTGCQATDQVVVTVNPLPIVNAGTDQSVCYNASVTLAGSGANTYTWNNGVTNNVMFNATATTTYTVTGTVTATGCQNTDQVLVTVNALQPAAFSVSTMGVYRGQNGVVYTVPNDPLVNSYTWSITGTGATGTGSVTNSETFNFSTTAGTGSRTVSVVANTTSPACASPARSMTVLVLDRMPWTGNVDNDWNTAGNWAGNFVPYPGIAVTIPNMTNDPFLTGAGPYTVRDLEMTGGILTIDAGTELNVTEELINEGTVTGDYVVLNGAAAQEVSGSGTIDNLELDNAMGAEIISGTFKVAETYLPTNGVLTTNGNLTLTSNATTTASVLAPGALCTSEYIDGEVTVEKWFPGGRRAFRFLAHPFNEWKPLTILTDDMDITGNGGATNGFTTTGTNNPSAYWFHTWIASNNVFNDVLGWVPFHTTNGFGTASWDRGEGMRILVRGALGEGLNSTPYTPSPVKIDMPGILNQCDVSWFLHDNGNIGVTGYNFKGNPYACNIDLIQAQRGDSVGNCFAVWDPHQGVRGAYVIGSFTLMSSYILPAYSSFFVTSNGDTNGVDNIITFTESMKTLDPADNTLFKTTGTGIGSDAVQLRILTNNDSLSWDRLLIYFRNNTSAQFDEQDGRKFINPAVNFYTISDTNNLAIDARPLVANSTIPLGFNADSAMQYTIRVDDYDVTGAQLYLIDKFLNETTPLSVGMHYDFTVTSNPLSQGDNRFEIGISTTGVEQVGNGKNMNLRIVPNPAEDYVTVSFDALKAGNTEISIKNLMGQEVYRSNLGNVQSKTMQIPVNELASGTYIVTISCGDQVMTQRLIKK